MGDLREDVTGRIAAKDENVVRHFTSLPFSILDVAAANCASASAQHAVTPPVLYHAPDVEQRLLGLGMKLVDYQHAVPPRDTGQTCDNVVVNVSFVNFWSANHRHNRPLFLHPVIHLLIGTFSRFLPP